MPTTASAGVSAADLATALREAGCATADISPGRVAQYSADASNYRQTPLAVVFPTGRDDVVRTVEVCRGLGVPVTMRGGGTSIAGQSLGRGVIIDCSSSFNRIIAIDPVARTATVEPGVILDDLQAAAAAHGLMFGPDPSTHSRCTIGGMLGNNACGAHSLAWGRTADNVIELEVLTYDGTIMTVRATSAADLTAIPGEGGRRHEVLTELYALVQENLSVIRTEFGRFPRQVSGYALEHLLPERGFNIARALVGSEGTCAIVLAAKLALVEPPPARALAALSYADVATAADAVAHLLPHRPLALEGLDRGITEALVRPSSRAAVEALPRGDAWLFIELGGADLAEAAGRAEELAVLARNSAVPCMDSLVVRDPDQQRLLWSVREDGAGLATRRPDGAEAWPGWEDAAVPPERLGDYLRAFTVLMRRYGRSGGIYGHFGEGCLHIRLDFDLRTSGGVADFRAFLTEAAQLVFAHNGSLSGEHGDGQARAELLPYMYSPAAIGLFERFKAIWDPGNLLNPGMVVNPFRIDDNLRPAARVARDTVFAYRADGGDFARAVDRCVGVGKCRSTRTSLAMCPSFRVTRDERESTRGRARVLQEMLRGEVVTRGWRSTEVRDTLDLCLSCKACQVDCPVSVDMATYKSEFLYHHYHRRLRPAAHYTMGWLPMWSRLTSRMTRTANAVLRSPIAPILKQLGGVAAEREIPRFARRSFSSTRKNSTVPAPSDRTVVLWVDTFNNFFTPHVLHAAVEVLESAGYSIVTPPGTQCCGLTWITTGQLGIAKRVIKRTLKALRPFLVSGYPIVGLEPSCTVTLRTELPAILPDDPLAQTVAAGTVSLSELLHDRTPGWAPPPLPAESISQTHCHQNATYGSNADQELLRQMGVRNHQLPPGCCGLAGNFGFERGHYAVSVAVGEQALLPAVRSADADTLVLADGFSCRIQISQLSNREPRHLAEVLAAAIRASRGAEKTGQPAADQTSR